MKNITSEYDGLIQVYAKEYLPGEDWRLIKAQLIQESRLDPHATSPVGAMGLAQFMPATWKEVAKEMQFPDHATAYDPRYAIPACCYYMAKLQNTWKSPRPEIDRRCLALASYNAGLGNVLKAQKKANGASSYAEIIKAMPLVTGEKNAAETRGYAVKILGYYNQMVTG